MSGGKLSIEHLRIAYPTTRKGHDEVVVCEDLGLTVGDGEFVAVVGPSGCGKSSLLYAINGLLDETAMPAGEIHVGDRRVRGKSKARDLALVFQDASLFPWLTAIDNVAFGLTTWGTPKKQARARAQEMIELVELQGFEEKYPHELSGGMQQRVNLARALAVDPQILLLDEPFSALDAQTREFMQIELTRIWEETHKTALFITHDIAEAVFLADRVIVLSARPSRILLDLDIEFERTRPLSIKRTERFQQYIDQIWRLIVQESAGAPAAVA